ncbi:T9SS type A sorting domain-containing protein [Hymenobacter cellulosivorans]|uniref:T9SS type A sorting domain-containing protein n=1 Tax=Hymenobacter cellulosivorans TaxID=2932249 RepID=A0ABY4F5Q7_9BACT|nr:T9SS type A sorting domain-containing protein [Hymenobacter cellulosivorans]UOQ51814.1 T9SS type A sorting domain-containing protein [Hymenobacter cellulosivorans]
MNKLSLLITGFVLSSSICQQAGAQQLDAGFSAGSIYAPSHVYSAVEQANGKRLVTGSFTRANGSAVPHLVRFNADGSVDAAFQQHLGASTGAYRLIPLSNGQLYLTSVLSGAPVVAGGISRMEPLRLNADGTADASFHVGSGAEMPNDYGFVNDAVLLPDGKTMVVGYFDTFNGVPAPGIVRLTATGSVDNTFQAGLGVNHKEIARVVALPGGKLLIGGDFTSYNGNPCHGIARLNADGSFDATFTQALNPTSATRHIVVQPDGKLLLAGDEFIGSGASSLVRLLANGTPDASFATPPDLPLGTLYSYSGNAIELQPDGKILFISFNAQPNTSISGVGRLNADGSYDSSFRIGTGPNNKPDFLTLLSSGQVLVGGDITAFSGTLNRGLVQLTSTGALAPTFAPVLQHTGTVQAMLRQADGKLVVGGNFSEINGQPAQRLARLTASGSLDATFSSATTGLNGTVVALAQQPDGRLLAATEEEVRRYQPTGQSDASLNAPDFGFSRLRRLVLQPDGRILLAGGGIVANGTSLAADLIRLTADGALDNSFTPPTTGAGRFSSVQSLALQPDGKLLVAGSYYPTSTYSIRTVARLTASGAVDPSFTGEEFESPANEDTRFNSLVVQPDGKVVVGGAFSTYGTMARANVARLNTDGTLDSGFTPPVTSGEVHSVLVQPNNRVLLGGLFAGAGLPANLARLLPDGRADASFGTTATPDSTVHTVLVQPDGGLVVGGTFTAIGTQSRLSLARITAPNVLHVASQAVADRTQAWPVPAHSTLHVATDPSAQATFLDLLDVLGRPVLHQALRSGAATTSLALPTLPAGTYLLRVTYKEGAVVRRIQVQ